jgi:hypothetical protein
MRAARERDESGDGEIDESDEKERDMRASRKRESCERRER